MPEASAGSSLEVTLTGFHVGGESNTCAVGAPVHIDFTYRVSEVVSHPTWSVAYIADIAAQCVRVELVPATDVSVNNGEAGSDDTDAERCGPSSSSSSSSTAFIAHVVAGHVKGDGSSDSPSTAAHPALIPGVRYKLSVHVLDMAERVRNVPEKYLLQVGMLQLTLRSAETSKQVEVNVVCQVRKPSTGTGLMTRTFLSPLE